MVLQGAADNWTPAARCEAFMAGAKARGAPVEFKLYPNAHHTFDAPNQAVRPLPQYRTANGVVPLSGTEDAARADALVRVPEFLGAASQRSVARMKRSEIRDRLAPHSAALHAGYE